NAVAQDADDAIAALVEQAGERARSAVEEIRELGDAGRKAPDHGTAGLVELRRERRGALPDQIADAGAALVEGAGELVRVVRQTVDDGLALAVEGAGEIARLSRKRADDFAT